MNSVVRLSFKVFFFTEKSTYESCEQYTEPIIFQQNAEIHVFVHSKRTLSHKTQFVLECWVKAHKIKG